MAAGIGGCLFYGVICAYTIILIARVEKQLLRDNVKLERMTYPELAGEVFPYKAWGIRVHVAIVYLAIVLTCIGSCIVYIIFICQTLPQAVPMLTSVCYYNI